MVFAFSQFFLNIQNLNGFAVFIYHTAVIGDEQLGDVQQTGALASDDDFVCFRIVRGGGQPQIYINMQVVTVASGNEAAERIAVGRVALSLFREEQRAIIQGDVAERAVFVLSCKRDVRIVESGGRIGSGGKAGAERVMRVLEIDGTGSFFHAPELVGQSDVMILAVGAVDVGGGAVAQGDVKQGCVGKRGFGCAFAKTIIQDTVVQTDGRVGV